MPASRPYWKGYIKLALVSCPIGLYPASSTSERVAFRQINRKSGNRLRQQLVDDQTREPVEGHDRAKGYEVAKNSYILIEDEEIEAIEIESNHTIEIDSFVPRSEIDDRYYDSPYYIAPNEPVGQEAFAVIREAMRGKNMAALGRVALSKRERVIMLQPWDKGLLGMTLHYPYEIRNAKDYFYDIPEIKVDRELLTLAEHILKTKEAHFDPNKFVDRYEQALLEMLTAKEKGLPAKPASTFAAPRNMPNLFDAFRQSLAQEQGHSVPANANKAKAAKIKSRVRGQGELLLPIPGKKARAAGTTEETKPAPTPARRKKAS